MVRFKNRYFTVEIVPTDGSDKPLILKTAAIHNAVQQKVQQLYGDFGLAAIKAGFNAKYCNAQTRIALIKARHGPHKFILNSIPLINDVGDRSVKVKILYVGATMKHCFLFLRTFQRKKLEEMWNSFRNDQQRKDMQETLMTLASSMKNFR